MEEENGKILVENGVSLGPTN